MCVCEHGERRAISIRGDITSCLGSVCLHLYRQAVTRVGVGGGGVVTAGQGEEPRDDIM